MIWTHDNEETWALSHQFKWTELDRTNIRRVKLTALNSNDSIEFEWKWTSLNSFEPNQTNMIKQLWFTLTDSIWLEMARMNSSLVRIDLIEPVWPNWEWANRKSCESTRMSRIRSNELRFPRTECNSLLSTWFDLNENEHFRNHSTRLKRTNFAKRNLG